METRMTTTCSAPDCDQPVNARGWCSTHYGRWRRTGDPQVNDPVVRRIVKNIKPEDVYEVLVAYIAEHHYAPTVRELGELVGLDSPASVQGHLDTLEHRGLIERMGPRAIKIKERP